MNYPKFDFDDILIVPTVYSDIESRYNNIKLPEQLPLFTAPMDTVVNLKNIKHFLNLGINVTLPRTISEEQFIDDFVYNKIYSKGIKNLQAYNNVFTSLGFGEIDKLLNGGCRLLRNDAHILIDVANGHMTKIIDYAKRIKEIRPDAVIMVGNIANPETYLWYAQSKVVDYVRVGIGNGGGCLTTKQSGVGYPMASLISEIRTKKLEYVYDNQGDNLHFPPAIVADGGMKDYSDVIKALALGADYVMLGSIFNKSIESCAPNYFHGVKINGKLAGYLFDKGYPVKKYFRGMSTKEAQKAMGKKTYKTSEGVVRYRRVEYHLDGWVHNFEHYLRNAMSYSGAKTLDEFRGKAEIIQITKNAYDRFNK